MGREWTVVVVCLVAAFVTAWGCGSPQDGNGSHNPWSEVDWRAILSDVSETAEVGMGFDAGEAHQGLEITETRPGIDVGDVPWELPQQPSCPQSECIIGEKTCVPSDYAEILCVDGCADLPNCPPCGRWSETQYPCPQNEMCPEELGFCACPNLQCNWCCSTDKHVCDLQGDCCLPDCAGKECGDNGCGGSCGECPVKQYEAGTFTRTVVVNGITRTYQLHVPHTAVDAMANGPVPVMVAYHGAGDNAANFIAATELTSAASSNATVLIAADGFNAAWYVQFQEGWPGSDGNETSLQNDAELTFQMLEEVDGEYSVDEGRFFAVGHSRGAALVGMLAVLSGGMSLSSGMWVSPFATYGINAGYDAFGGSVGLSNASPKHPVWLIHGTSDGVVPFSYGSSFAAGLEGAGWDVTFTQVQGAPHTWLWRPQFGQTNQDLWDFCLSHSL